MKLRNLLLGCCLLIATSYCDNPNTPDLDTGLVLVQLDLNGNPFNCWMLENSAINDNLSSIWWNYKNISIATNSLYMSVRVENKDWDLALKEVKLTKETCNQLHNTMFVPAKPNQIVLDPIQVK